ncbi:hypothetical protein [Frigoribacterium sp. CFBP 13712]|uniref:hypothetical protein n=1 Tax=Frigoribacterium sp. CFBP 13712 TaxID=2775309 RepID=UPI0017858DEE|nr:hypothetical protein [Frigoribacterium sp. CFBP 13712]MBD8703987.1 hypothetical protein [Frigoribacterium sp. CFBP 13712]
MNSAEAFRVKAGVCEAGAALELEKTIDGGATWATFPVTTDLVSAFRLQAIDSSYAFIVGSGGVTCDTGLTATYSSGAGFQTYPDRVAAAWYLNPAVPTTIHSPSGDRVSPCSASTAVSLAPASDTSAAVLCADRTLFQTIDAGASWSDSLAVPGAVAITDSSGEYVLASEGLADCQGLAISEIPSSVTNEEGVPIGCAGNETLPTSAGENVTLAASSGSVWLSAGDATVVSVDGGVTW